MTISNSPDSNLSNAQVDAIVQRYLESLSTLTPTPITLEYVGFSNYKDDSRLLNMIALKDAGNPLRLCTNQQIEALRLRIIGKKCESILNKSQSGEVTEIARKTKRMTIIDIAARLNMSIDRCKQLIRTARELVRAALRDNKRLNG